MSNFIQEPGLGEMNTKQRIITTNDILPKQDRNLVALNEHAIGDHLDPYLLAEDNKTRTFVFSSFMDGPHLYCYAPSKILNRNYWTIVTMGMSGTVMNVPEDIPFAQHYQRAEVNYFSPFSVISDCLYFSVNVLPPRELDVSKGPRWRTGREELAFRDAS